MAALRRLAMVLGRCVPTGHSGPMLAEAQGGVRGLATNAHARAKFYADPMEAVKDISDRAKIMVGGFGLCGIPENLIKVLLETHVKDLTVVSSNVGMDDFGLGLLLETKQIPRIIGSHVGERAVRAPLPVGRAGAGAAAPGRPGRTHLCRGAGVPSFYTPTAYRTLAQEGGTGGRRPRGHHEPAPRGEEFQGDHYLLEQAISARFALVKGWKADRAGNVIFRRSARNFNVPMCKAAETSVVEVKTLWMW